MGVTTCEIHGQIGVDFTCNHIIQNMLEKKAGDCVQIKVHAFDSLSRGNSEEPVDLFDISVCHDCFQKYSLSKQQKVYLTQSQIDELLPIQPFCALCVSEYTLKNQV